MNLNWIPKLSCVVVSIVALNACGASNHLTVYVPAHPDDVEFAFSSTLFALDYEKSPILVVLATDGGADDQEYTFDLAKGWLKADGARAVEWPIPEGKSIQRTFYSADLARKRIGGYFSDGKWIRETYTHPSINNETALDFLSRVSLLRASAEVLSYSGAGKNSMLFPDGGFKDARDGFVENISKQIAELVEKTVQQRSLDKDLLIIDTHACSEVSSSENYHPDHIGTGDAVRKAVDILKAKYGFKKIVVRWHSIMELVPANPKLKVQYLSLSEKQKTQVLNFVEKAWEYVYINGRYGEYDTRVSAKFIEVSY